MNTCLENATLLTAERNISGVKKLTHCGLHGEEEGPVKWHQLGTSCKVGHRATGMKPRAGDALQMCPAHTGASGHAALPGLWQQLPVERGWQRLWRGMCRLGARAEEQWAAAGNRRLDENRGYQDTPDS